VFVGKALKSEDNVFLHNSVEPFFCFWAISYVLVASRISFKSTFFQSDPVAKRERQRELRVSLTLPSSYLQHLRRWAEDINEQPTSLAARLTMAGIDTALKEGRIPLGTSPYQSMAQLIGENWERLAKESEVAGDRLKAIKGGARPDEMELLKIACSLKLSIKEVRILD